MKADRVAEAMARQEDQAKTIVNLNSELQQLHRELKTEKMKKDHGRNAATQANQTAKTIVERENQLQEMKHELATLKLREEASTKEKEELRNELIIAQSRLAEVTDVCFGLF